MEYLAIVVLALLNAVQAMRSAELRRRCNGYYNDLLKETKARGDDATHYGEQMRKLSADVEVVMTNCRTQSEITAKLKTDYEAATAETRDLQKQYQERLSIMRGSYTV